MAENEESSESDNDEFLLLEEETKIRDNIELLPPKEETLSAKIDKAYARPTLARLRTSSFFDPFAGFGEAPSPNIDPYDEIDFDFSPEIFSSISKCI